MDNELGVLIQAKLDVQKSVQEINKDLQTLTKQLQSLELNVDLGKATKDIQDFNKNIEKSLGSAGKGAGNVGQQITDSVSIDLDKLRKNHSDVFAEIDKLQKHYGGTIQSIKRQGGLDLTDSSDPERLNRVNVALKDLNGTLRNFEIRQMDGGLEIVGFDEISNIEKARKESEKLAESMGKGREQSLERQRKEQEKLAQTQARYSNKAIDDAHKEALAQKKKTEELRHQVKLAQDNARYNVQDLRRRYNPVLTPEDNKALDNYLNSMNSLNATTPNVRRQIQSLQSDFKGITSNVKDAGSKVEGFGKQLQIALTRIPIWIKLPIVQVKPL